MREDRSTDGVLGDLDGDDDLDIVISTNGSSRFKSYSLLNTGGGYYPADNLQDLFPSISNYTAVASGDIERDGDQDLLFSAFDDSIRLLVNEGGLFLDSTGERLPGQTGSWSATDGALIDVDGDIFLDITFVQDGTGRIWMNDGRGYFRSSNPGQFPTGFIYSNAFSWGDVDRDLDIDCVIANNTGYANMLMINDGSGWFSDETEVRLPIETSPSNGVNMIDVDGDRDLDIIVAGGTPPGYDDVWINNGSGYFADESDQRLPDYWDTSLDVAFGDIDNDRDFDLFFANNGLNDRFNRLLINGGNGYFTDETDQRFPFAEETSVTIVPGDVDLDGDLDCFIVNFGESSDFFPGQDRLLINQSTPDSFPPTIPRTYNHPDTGDTTNPYLITTTVWDNISVVIGELKASLFYRSLDDTTGALSDADFLEIQMLDCGGFLYRERIPAQSSGIRVEYYIKAEDRMGNVSYDPPNAPDSVFSFLVDAALGIGDRPPSSPLPKSFSLSQNYPNPFNPSTTIDYSIPEGERVQARLKIFDIRGRLIRTLLDTEKKPGRYSIHWDGRDDKGEEVRSGVYLYRIEAGDFTSTKKMILAQ